MRHTGVFFKISYLLFYCKLVDTFALVGFSRTNHYTGEAGLVGTVGIVLCLQAEGTTMGINDTGFAFVITRHEVTCVELNTRFICINLQLNTCLCAIGCTSNLGDVSVGVQHPVVVITTATNQLLE